MRRALFLLLLFCLLLTAGCGVNSVSQPKTGTLITTISGCEIGAFVNGMGNLGSFQNMIGRNLGAVPWYISWQDPFPTTDADKVYANGSVPLITWEPWITHPLGTLEAISAGSYESYVKSFIQAAKDWGGPVLLRFAHEMNGNWYPWDGYHNGADASAPEKYKNAWIYIYNVKQSLAADNVYLVWCPNNTNQPGDPWNTASAYYPGDQYVNWIGMDGYNWGYSSWGTFDQVFGAIYQELTALTAKPLMIGEFASAEQGGSKADWITDCFSKIKSTYTRIKLFCWFNINKERDWRIDSSPTSEAAAKNALQESFFLDKMMVGN